MIRSRPAVQSCNGRPVFTKGNAYPQYQVSNPENRDLLKQPCSGFID